tara:strand:- start:314 stop:961 length:648 start_codon:yes stop_codon:yes gene_type:complete
MNTKKARAIYKFKVNNSVYETDIECPTGLNILSIAGFEDPTCYDLILVKRGKDELIKNDQEVCLSDPGVERFRVRPKKVKDGDKGGDSLLPLKDIEFLDREFKGCWSLKRQNNLNLLRIQEFQVPKGYNVTDVDMIIIIPDRYDSVQLDMAYFKPALSRADGRSINNLASQVFAGESFQRWSRHRDNDNPWIIGVDCIESHVELIRFFLRKELER